MKPLTTDQPPSVVDRLIDRVFKPARRLVKAIEAYDEERARLGLEPIPPASEIQQQPQRFRRLPDGDPVVRRYRQVR